MFKEKGRETLHYLELICRARLTRHVRFFESSSSLENSNTNRRRKDERKMCMELYELPLASKKDQHSPLYSHGRVVFTRHDVA